jgi:hypothetical protein
MPRRWDSLIVYEGTRIFLPPTKSSPRVMRFSPMMHLDSVDFPAPFSPTRPWHSPGMRAKLTSSRALTPGNSIVQCLTSSKGVLSLQASSPAGESLIMLIVSIDRLPSSGERRSLLGRDPPRTGTGLPARGVGSDRNLSLDQSQDHFCHS